MQKIIYTTKAPEPVGPYSQAILANNTLYISGQIPIYPQNNQLIQGGIEAETKQVLANINAILEEAGFNKSEVVKCTIFLKKMSDFKIVNELYATYFGETKPARETIEVSCLPKDVLVEISAIAVK